FTCPHTTRRWFTELLPLPILITLIPIRGTTPGWGWRGARPDLRWVPGPAVPGATAIGTTATSTSTTRIILTRITLTTSIVATSIAATLITARQAAVRANTIPNIAAMRLMGIAERPASLAAVARVVPVERVVSEVLGAQVVLAVSGDLAVQVAQAVLVVSAGRVVLVGLANQVVQVASVAWENPGAQGGVGKRVAPVVPVALDQRDVRAAAQARGPQHDRAGVAAPIKLGNAAYLQVQGSG